MAAPARLMWVGDSITVGYNYENLTGYVTAADTGPREHTYDLLVADGFEVEFVGHLANGFFAQPRHEGRASWPVARMDAYLQARVARYRPEILCVMLGTNDGNNGDTVGAASAAVSDYGTLVDNLVAVLPDAEVVLATIPPRSGYGTFTPTFNAALWPLAYSRQVQGHRVRVSDVGAAVTTADLPDGVHPGAAGYAKLAEAWAMTLRGILAARRSRG